MPNWFYFTIDVNGSKKDIEEFVNNVEGSEEFETEGREFDFNHFIPQPNSIFRENVGRDIIEKLDAVGIPNWYDWNVNNWGTKWNAHCEGRDIHYSSEDGICSTRYRLETAWSFPSPIIEKMLKKYSHLSFEIEGEEESQEYGVFIRHDNGKTISWREEEPTYIDPLNDRAISYCSINDGWMYDDSATLVEDSDDLYPETKYSWN